MTGIGIRRNLILKLFLINCARNCDNNVKGKTLEREEKGWFLD